MQTSNWSARYFLVIVLVNQLVVCITIIFDVPIARQVIGFFYLTFVPGFVLLKILGIYDFDRVEAVLFCVGLSIGFWMLIGLFVNELCPVVNVFEPLSQTNFLLISSGSMVLLVFLSYRVIRDLKFSTKTVQEGAMHYLKALHAKRVLIYSVLIACVPLLSVVGTFSVNTSGDNVILLSMMILISALIFSVTAKFPRVSYSLAMLSIAIALMFHISLTSNYIHGHDIHSEYYVSRMTEVNLWWNPCMHAPARLTVFNSMLSVTLLSTICSTILNVEGTWILKIVYPLIFSFVPVGLYKLYQTRMEKKIAFLSVFFFMANETFVQPTSNAKQMIAEVFYVLLFLVLFNKKMKPLGKWLCFALFSFGLVTSHYASSYIFLFLISLTFLFMFLMENFLHRKKAKNITASAVLLFLAIGFSWYIYVAYSAPFHNLVEVGEFIFRSVSAEFLNPASRSEGVLTAMGLEASPSFWHTISRGYFYVTEFLILVGLIVLVTGRMKVNFDQEFKLLVYFCFGIVLLSIILPGFARSLRIERFYHFALMFLAPLCIMGGRTLLKSVLKLKTTKYRDLFLISFLLIPFFLFQYGFIFEVAGDPVPSSVSLSNYRLGEEGYDSKGLIYENEIFGARWLSKYATENALLYADSESKVRILSSGYTMVPPEDIILFSLVVMKIYRGTYIYLRQYNIINGIVNIEGHLNVTELYQVINSFSKIYSNGGCDIYENTGVNVTINP